MHPLVGSVGNCPCLFLHIHSFIHPCMYASIRKLKCIRTFQYGVGPCLSSDVTLPLSSSTFTFSDESVVALFSLSSTAWGKEFRLLLRRLFLRRATFSMVTFVDVLIFVGKDWRSLAALPRERRVLASGMVPVRVVVVAVVLVLLPGAVVFRPMD